jgi:methylglutaconyl-CoA hydratase
VTDEPILLHRVERGVAYLTLNRPEKRNALNARLVAALVGAIEGSARDDEVRVVAITGAGKDFCSGADLAELERITAMGSEENLADATALGAMLAGLRHHPKPVVALVRGRALAGGCGLASACDLVLASEDAVFGYPEVHLGFVPALVMTILRRKVAESRAFELVVRGHRIDAATALEIGLVNATFESSRFDAAAREYVEDLASRPPIAVRLTKRLLYDLDDLAFDAGMERAARVNAEARVTEECRAGVRRFLDKTDR